MYFNFIQEVVVQGEDKVFKDVIEPLESVSVNMIPTSKEDIRDLGPPQAVSSYLFSLKLVNFYHVMLIVCSSQVAEALVKKVLAPASQKTKLVEATEVLFLSFILFTVDMIEMLTSWRLLKI